MLVAVILSGCGYRDGAEVTESVLSLVELSANELEFEVFAPDRECEAINHITGEPDGAPRNMLVESARIARGGVSNLMNLDPARYGALVMPGGFGVAKNLSNVAISKNDPSIMHDVKKSIVAFHAARKPIVAVCISPAIVGFCLPGVGASLTLGTEDSGGMIARSGNVHVPCQSDSYVIDGKHAIISTPAFMNDAPLHAVAAGIKGAISILKEKLS